MDDVLDLTASEEVLGKPVASDLREGKATMAVVTCAGGMHAGRARQDRDHSARSGFQRGTHAQILDILTRYGSLDYAIACATEYADKARSSICTFADSEFKRALLWVPEFVVAREK